MEIPTDLKSQTPAEIPAGNPLTFLERLYYLGDYQSVYDIASRLLNTTADEEKTNSTAPRGHGESLLLIYRTSMQTNLLALKAMASLFLGNSQISAECLEKISALDAQTLSAEERTTINNATTIAISRTVFLTGCMNRFGYPENLSKQQRASVISSLGPFIIGLLPARANTAVVAEELRILKMIYISAYKNHDKINMSDFPRVVRKIQRLRMACPDADVNDEKFLTGIIIARFYLELATIEPDRDKQQSFARQGFNELNEIWNFMTKKKLQKKKFQNKNQPKYSREMQIFNETREASEAESSVTGGWHFTWLTIAFETVRSMFWMGSPEEARDAAKQLDLNLQGGSQPLTELISDCDKRIEEKEEQERIRSESEAMLMAMDEKQEPDKPAAKKKKKSKKKPADSPAPTPQDIAPEVPAPPDEKEIIPHDNNLFIPILSTLQPPAELILPATSEVSDAPKEPDTRRNTGMSAKIHPAKSRKNPAGKNGRRRGKRKSAAAVTLQPSGVTSPHAYNDCPNEEKQAVPPDVVQDFSPVMLIPEDLTKVSLAVSPERETQGPDPEQMSAEGYSDSHPEEKQTTPTAANDRFIPVADDRESVSERSLTVSPDRTSTDSVEEKQSALSGDSNLFIPATHGVRPPEKPPVHSSRTHSPTFFGPKPVNKPYHAILKIPEKVALPHELTQMLQDIERATGVKTFIVGSYSEKLVKYAMMGEPPPAAPAVGCDVDIAVLGAITPEQRQIFDSKIRRLFPLIHLCPFEQLQSRLYQLNLVDWNFEFFLSNVAGSLSSIEAYIRANALSRDFTLSAIFIGSDGTVLDPLNGIQDSCDRILRTTGDPDFVLTDDPVRALRALYKMVGSYCQPEPGLDQALGSFTVPPGKLAESVYHREKRRFAQKFFAKLPPLNAAAAAQQMKNLIRDYALDRLPCAEPNACRKTM